MPRITRNLSRRVPIGPRPDPEAFGAAEGRAMVRLGGAVRGVGDTVREVGRELADLSDGYQQQLSISKSTEADESLRRFAEDLEQDPDFKGREKRFTDRASELREELGRDIDPGPRKFEFELALTRARNRHAITVRSTALRDEMSSAELLANNTARRLATVAATSSSPFDQAVARLEGQNVYVNLGERFGIDQAHTDEAVRHFNLEVDDAIFAERLRTDPVDAYRRLEEPFRGLAKGRTEVERQAMLTKAINAVESRLRSTHQDEISRQRVADLRRKEASRNAQNGFVAAAQTPEGLSLDTVNDLGDTLDPTVKRGWIQWIMDTGGKIQRTRLNPLVYQKLSDQAKLGEDVTSLVYEAERNGDLDAGSRNAILTQSTDSRFDVADQYLKAALKVGEFVRSPAVKLRNAEALMSYDLWKIENPKASLGEAVDQAQMQAKRALIFDADSITAFQLPPQFAVYDDGTLNAKETSRALTKHHRDNPKKMSRAELDRELDLVERFETAQKAQATRVELQAQQAEARAKK